MGLWLAVGTVFTTTIALLLPLVELVLEEAVPLGVKYRRNRTAIVSIDSYEEMRYEEEVNSMETYPHYTKCFNKFRLESGGSLWSS